MTKNTIVEYVDPMTGDKKIGTVCSVLGNMVIVKSGNSFARTAKALVNDLLGNAQDKYIDCDYVRNIYNEAYGDKSDEFIRALFAREFVTVDNVESMIVERANQEADQDLKDYIITLAPYTSKAMFDPYRYGFICADDMLVYINTEYHEANDAFREEIVGDKTTYVEVFKPILIDVMVELFGLGALDDRSL